MERKVSTFDVKIGMYVANLDRPWLDTPFLIQGFLIKDDEEIVALQQQCEYVYIDTEQGEEADTYLDNAPATEGNTYVDDFLEGGMQKVIYKTEKDEFQEIPAAEIALENATVKVANIMDNLKAGDNLDMHAVRAAVEPVMESMVRNSDAMLWLTEMREKDAYSYTHSIDNCSLAIAFGRHLGLYKEDLRSLAMGCLLMDIGKVKISKTILNNTGTLTRDEFVETRKHVKYGMDILRKSSGVSEGVLEVVHGHHERFDGSGYPNGLEGKQIPVFARIAGIIDTYNAMTHDSPHRKAASPHTVLQIMYSWRNKFFQDELVEQFLQCVGVYPTGSVIEMSTGEVGIVIAQNRKQRLKPRILMLLDEHKDPYPGPKIVDLQTQAVDYSGHEYTILHGLQPDAYGINPADYKL
jgi:HD-GYP domain-containing protein (c-di-GMP phosphodiesterase class II)